MEALSIIYLSYMFISIYLLVFNVLLYWNNRKTLFEEPPLTKEYSLSIVIPCWNEEKSIRATIENLLELDYGGLKKIIVVDDCSNDSSYKIIREMAVKYDKVMAVQTPMQTGNAGGAKAFGSKFVETELIGFTDADSYPEKDSMKKLVGFFDDSQVGAVTGVFTPKNQNKFFEKLQSIEYNVIAFTRKLLGYVDGIYVTPGPLAIYRKSAFDDVGGFDVTNMTEDIEIVWNLISKKYKIRMCLSAHATTIIPTKFKGWWNQRIRWAVGGLQCIAKHKKHFLKKGMLGLFVVPFFIVQFFLGMLGMGIFVYLLISKFFKEYIFAKYSIQVGTALVTMEDFHITASFLNYLGIILFVFGFVFTLIVISIMKRHSLKRHSVFNLLFYSTTYLLLYPVIATKAVYNFIRKKDKWR
jgi:poly-beta-1,6-N-acetyl-D-glucosamine synthase